MRKIGLLFLLAIPCFAQPSNPGIISVTVAPSGACHAGLPNQQVLSTGAQYSCQNGTWGALGGGAGGSTPWSSLTAPVGDLGLVMSNSKTMFGRPLNPFTPQASFYSTWGIAGNAINFGTEWNTIYSSYMPNAYPSDVFDVGITVPNTSTVFQSNAIGGFVNCSQPSGNHYCVAISTVRQS